MLEQAEITDRAAGRPGANRRGRQAVRPVARGHYPGGGDEDVAR